MNEKSCTFTIPEWDYIANALADRPWKEVNGLLAKLVNQMNSQPEKPPAPLGTANPTDPLANVQGAVAQATGVAGAALGQVEGVLQAVEGLVPPHRGPALLSDAGS